MYFLKVYIFWKNSFRFYWLSPPKQTKMATKAAIFLTNNNNAAAETEAKAAPPDQYPSEFPFPVSSPDGADAGYEKSCHDSAAMYSASGYHLPQCQAAASSHWANTPHTVLSGVSCVCNEPFPSPFM